MTRLAALLVLAAATPAGEPPVRHVVPGREAPVYAIAGGKGSAQLLLHEGTGARAAALSVLLLAPGAEVPEHVHEASVEVLYVEEGTVEMTIDGKRTTAGAGDAIYIPAGVKHSARVTGRLAPLRAVQVYVGPGPEQRFARGERVPAE